MIFRYLWYRISLLLSLVGGLLFEASVLIWLRPIVRDYLSWPGNTAQRMRDQFDVEDRYAWAYKRASEASKMTAFILFTTTLAALFVFSAIRGI